MEGKLSEAKNMAMSNLIKKAVALESNALIGIDYDIMTIGKSMIVVSVNGTAVLIEKIEHGELNE